MDNYVHNVNLDMNGKQVPNLDKVSFYAIFNAYVELSNVKVGINIIEGFPLVLNIAGTNEGKGVL